MSKKAIFPCLPLPHSPFFSGELGAPDASRVWRADPREATRSTRYLPASLGTYLPYEEFRGIQGMTRNDEQKVAIFWLLLGFPCSR